MPTSKPNGHFDYVSVVAESSYAAGAEPTAASFGLVVPGSVSIDPQSQEVGNPPSMLGHPGRNIETRARLMPKNFSFDVYMQGSGSAGSAESWVSAIMKAARLSETIVGSTSVTYAWASNPTDTCQLYFANDNEMAILLGCVITQIKISVSTEDTEPMKLSITGTFARRLNFHKTTLDGDIDNAVTSLTIADTDNVDTGQDGTSESSLYIPIQIESEEMVITAYNWTTGVATVTRQAYTGTSIAAHSDAVDITPYRPTRTAAGGLLFGADDWTWSWGGVSTDILKWEITIDTGRKHEAVESGSMYATCYTNGMPMLSFTFDAISKDGNKYWQREADTRVEKQAVFTNGSTAGSISTFTIPRCRLQKAALGEGQEGTRVITRNVDCFDQETVLGAFSWVLT